MQCQIHSCKLRKKQILVSFRQWTPLALVKKTSLHFDRCKATAGLARPDCNMMWPEWKLMYSQRYCAFIDKIKLCLSTVINKFLIWVEYLLDHPVRQGWGKLNRSFQKGHESMKFNFRQMKKNTCSSTFFFKIILTFVLWFFRGFSKKFGWCQ
jgi:hypothetical protein